MYAALNQPTRLRIETRDYDGNLATPSGSVTVNVSDKLQNEIVQTGTASATSTGVYELTLGNDVITELGPYEATAIYTISGATSSVTYAVEVIGNHLFEIGELREMDNSLSSSTTYTPAQIRKARDEATQRIENAAQVPFSRRIKRATLSGDGTTRLMLDDTDIIEVMSVEIYGEDVGTDLIDEDFTAIELADVEIDAKEGVLVRTDHDWPEGHDNIIVEYEYGYQTTPGPVRRAAMLLAIEALVPSSLPPRATAQSTDLGDFRISLANPDAGRDTGIPEVDAVIAQYGRRRPRIA